MKRNMGACKFLLNVGLCGYLGFFGVLVQAGALQQSQEQTPQEQVQIVQVAPQEVQDLALHEALLHLQAQVIEHSKKDPQQPLASVLERYVDKCAVIFSWPEDRFFSASQTDGLPLKLYKSPLHISLEDWLSFQKFWTPENLQDLYSSAGEYEVTLVDLDEDGQRDLMISYFAGGTGIFSHTDFYRKDAQKGFVRVSQDAGFDTNDRGADNEIYLLKINGRSYIAYRNSNYGTDDVTLFRPLSVSSMEDVAERLTITYKYTHTVEEAALQDDLVYPNEDEQENEPIEEQRTLKDLEVYEAINAYFDPQKTQELASNTPQRCPLPDYAYEQALEYDVAPEELEELWPWLYAGHYTIDFIEYFVIQTQSGCYSARLVAQRGSGMSSQNYEQCCLVEVSDGPFDSSYHIDLQTQRTFVDAQIEFFPIESSEEPSVEEG